MAAGIRRPDQVVDGARLSGEAQAELKGLVAAARAAQSAETPASPGRGRDTMSYSVTVDDGGQPLVLKQSDSTMTPAFTALLEFLERQPR